MRTAHRKHLELYSDKVYFYVNTCGRAFHAFMVQVLGHYNVEVKKSELFTSSFFLNSYGLSTRGLNMLATFDRCLTDREYRRLRRQYYIDNDNSLRSHVFINDMHQMI